MKKSNVLKVVLSSALVASLAATAALSVSAAGIGSTADIKDHTVGVTGSFNDWASDVILTDEDGDGVYEGIVEVAEVTDAMITDWSVDDALTGEKYLQFKVRLDSDWTDSWGNYEPLHDRVYNSQSNVPVKEAVAGQPIKFKAIFDTTKVNPDALANPESYADASDPDSLKYDAYLTVSYEIIKEEESSVEESSEESSVVESSVESTASTDTSTVSSETPATQSSTDTTTVPTGDATSAAALAAVVVASLGVAVFMTKKASSKD